MKTILITILGSLSLLLTMNAQSYEIGGFTGASNYIGDLSVLGPDKQENNLAIGVFLRYPISARTSVKFHFYKGEISGNDNNYEGWKISQRNLNFKSVLMEWGAQYEYQLRKHEYRKKRQKLNPYFFAGLSIFRFNPVTEYNGKWVELQPLGTEGQGVYELSNKRRYDRTQVSIPMGIGFKFSPDPIRTIGLEIGIRKTFTDYLDDVSGNYPDLEALAEENPLAATLSYRSSVEKGLPEKLPSGLSRGNEQATDWYLFIGMTFSVKMNSNY